MVSIRKYGFCCLLLLAAALCSCGGEQAGGGVAGGSKGSIVESGEVVAVNSWTYMMPRFGRRWYSMMIVGILEQGALVQAGDSIIQLDAAEVNKFIIGREDNLETQRATLEKLIVNHDNRINDLEAGVKNSQAAYDLKKISLEASRFEAERIRKVRELEFKQAEITLNKEKRRLELARTINACELKVQQIMVGQIEDDVRSAHDILPQLTVRAPISGVFQIAHNWRTDNLIKLGDNIYNGNRVASIPSLEWMKVNTCVNETDYRKLSVGQKVAVRLDALPNVVFDGEVSYIGKLCHYKDNDPKTRQKVFDVEVRMLVSDERLKPGMTVSCEYLL